MADRGRGAERRRLEREIEGAEYAGMLVELKRRASLNREFRSWRDVLSALNSCNITEAVADDTLRPIFAAYAADRDHRWRTILIAIFWPALEAVHRRRWRWDRDAETRWSNITWVFLEAVDRIDVDRRRERFGAKVINDVTHNLYRHYRQEWKWRNREDQPGQEKLEKLVGGDMDMGIAAFEERDERETDALLLASLRARDRISEAEYLLLIGTFIYGQTMLEFAHEHGIDYQTVKKRRQRVAARIGWGERNFVR